MKPAAFSFIIFLLSFLKTHACGNEFAQPMTDVPMANGKINLDALIFADFPYFDHTRDPRVSYRFIELQGLSAASTGVRNASRLADYVTRQQAVRRLDYKLLSDLAWYGLKAGKKKEALELLEKLYEKYPTEYNIVANLGTAYEVNGDNAKALQYIREAVAINPASHRGSEWIHIKILEHKVGNTNTYRNIIDVDRERDASGKLKATQAHPAIHPDSLVIQLAYQLHERIAFIPPTDGIVAQLVHDFAVLIHQQHDSTAAAPFFVLAKTYQPEGMELNTGAAATSVEKPGTLSKKGFWNTSNTFWVILAVLVTVGGIVFVARKRAKTA